MKIQDSNHSALVFFILLVTYKSPQTCKAPLTPEASLPLATALNSASPDKSQNSTMNDNSGAAANADDGDLGSDAEGQILVACKHANALPSFVANGDDDLLDGLTVAILPTSILW